MKTAIALTTTLVAFTATAALADELAASSQMDHEALFEQFDANGDDRVSMREAAASMTLTEQFEALDEDASGDLTLAEFENLEMTDGLSGQGAS